MTKTLLIGGSGFISGTVARQALAEGHELWVVTRGRRPVPDGARSIVADRKDQAGFFKAIEDAGTTWDFVVDLVGFEPDDARQDVEVFRQRARQLVFISTDMVFDPDRVEVPTHPEWPHYADEGYGGKKRACEEELEAADTGDMRWTLVRPCHVYGPGIWLGCMHRHFRDPDLIETIYSEQTLTLVENGKYLQHPVFVEDLAKLILSCLGNEQAHGRAYMAAGPDIVPAREYYEIIAGELGRPLHVASEDAEAFLAEHPRYYPHLRNRVYDLTNLERDGVAVPGTALVDGLARHVAALKSQMSA